MLSSVIDKFIFPTRSVFFATAILLEYLLHKTALVLPQQTFNPGTEIHKHQDSSTSDRAEEKMATIT